MVEIFGEEICQEGRGGRANLGWFEYCRTSGSYGAHKWLEAKSDRVVPGSVITNIKQEEVQRDICIGREEIIKTHEMTNTTPLGRFKRAADQFCCQSCSGTVSSLAHSSS